MVVDTSALLAVIFNEDRGPWALGELKRSTSSLKMSTVNYAELLILVESRQPALFGEIRDLIASTSIRFVPPNTKHAEIAAEARMRFPINLGDCFAYALAKEQSEPILTLDRDFRKTDIAVILPRSR